MNWFGCALAGAQSQAAAVVAGVHRRDGQGPARPIGRDEMLPVSAAVAVDCLASAALAYDDIHFETTLHPAGPVAAAIFGVARQRQISGRAALQALRVGMEIECRVARALFAPEAGARAGWYPTGIAGGIGAAAATGRLLGQDPATMANSLALAASQASGTRGTHGAMSAYLPPAIAAEAGFKAALMADQGFTCPTGALDGPMGLARMIAATPAFDRALAGLGEVHVSTASAAKIYPYGFISYAVISCILCLHRWPAAEGREPERIELHVSPTCARLGANPLPQSAFDAQVSLPWIAARVLCDPALAFVPVDQDFLPYDPMVPGAARKVAVIAAPELGDEQARLEAHYAGGGKLIVDCNAAPGSAANPVTPAEVRAKFQRLILPLRGPEATDSLLQTFDDLESLDDLARLLQ